jgi:cyclohexanone monooxygenase
MNDDTCRHEFDSDALRDRYRRERDKRLRPDGIDQYLEATGRLARFVDHDPFAPPDVGREPIRDDVEVAIVGGGFSGLPAAARLTERGVTSFRIIEAGCSVHRSARWSGTTP